MPGHREEEYSVDERWGRETHRFEEIHNAKDAAVKEACRRVKQVAARRSAGWVGGNYGGEIAWVAEWHMGVTAKVSQVNQVNRTWGRGEPEYYASASGSLWFDRDAEGFFVVHCPVATSVSLDDAKHAALGCAAQVQLLMLEAQPFKWETA